MKIAVVGATGLVGGEILEVFEERNVQFDELYLVASARSAGSKKIFKGKGIHYYYHGRSSFFGT